MAGAADLLAAVHQLHAAGPAQARGDAAAWLNAFANTPQVSSGGAAACSCARQWHAGSQERAWPWLLAHSQLAWDTEATTFVVQAWQAALSLLDGQQPLEAQFFAANILLTKTRREWARLSTAERNHILAAVRCAWPRLPAIWPPSTAMQLPSWA